MATGKTEKKQFKFVNIFDPSVIEKLDKKIGEALRDARRRHRNDKARVVNIALKITPKGDKIDVDAKITLKLPDLVDPDVFHAVVTVTEAGPDQGYLFEVAGEEPDRPVRAIGK